MGDCRFERAGEKLTITVPGKGHGLEGKKGKLNGYLVFREELNGSTLTSSTPFTAKGKKAKKK